MEMSEMFDSVTQWVKDLWNSFDLQKWSEKIGGSSAEAVQAGFYFMLFFASGFLFKKYFKFIFVCLLLSLILVKVFEYNGFLQIDMVAIKKALGLVSAQVQTPGVPVEAGFNTLINSSFDWIKAHVLIFVSSVIGFLVGYKLG
ncbi:MAG: FUN14 domain-containing protein [bacterium]